MWAYDEIVDNHNRLNCKLCGKMIYGGISSLKYHLAKIVEHEMEVCPTITLEVMCLENKSLLDVARNRDEKEELRVELAYRTQSRSMGATSLSGVGEMHYYSSSTRTITSTMHSTSLHFFVLRSTLGGQPSIRSLIKTREKERANKLVAKCFLWGDIPFNIAKNNPLYHIPCLKLLLLLAQGIRALRIMI